MLCYGCHLPVVGKMERVNNQYGTNFSIAQTSYFIIFGLHLNCGWFRFKKTIQIKTENRMNKKKLIKTFVLAGLIVSCNTSNKTESTAVSPTKRDTKSTNKTPVELDKNLVEIDSDEARIATALMAAPAESREGCTVIGYNMAGEFVTLKEGTNAYICIADNPNQEGFNAACYHKSLEPFMARGRELKAEGKSATDIFDIREKEAKAGTLDMGKPGSTLHVYYGPSTLYDPETYEVNEAKYRYVVYIPWATSESTGLPEKPYASNHPWIMNPGTHRAHIMISPLAEEQE